MEIRKVKKESQSIKIIVEESGKEIGRAYLYLIKNDLHEEPYGLLEDVFVEPEHRGKGVGSNLVQEVIEAAKDHGCYKLIAQSRYSRENVHELYERIGFRDHGKTFRMDLK